MKNDKVVSALKGHKISLSQVRATAFFFLLLITLSHFAPKFGYLLN